MPATAVASSPSTAGSRGTAEAGMAQNATPSATSAVTSAGDVGASHSGPRDRAEDDGIYGERAEPVQHLRPRDRRPQQRVEREPEVGRQVWMDDRDLRDGVEDLAHDD